MICKNKKIVLIASGGRTGTNFLGENFSQIIPNSFSIHEPDTYKGLFRLDTWKAVEKFGFYHMMIGRLLGKTGIRLINDQYLSGKLNKEEIQKLIIQHREKYFSRQKAELIIESYSQWYGLFPSALNTFAHIKMIGIIRDPRTWLTSWMNHITTRHTKHDIVTLLGIERLKPNDIHPDIISNKDWETLSPFEKNCWDWAIIAEQLLHHDKTYEQAKLFRFEDLFLSENKQVFIEEMLEFATSFPDKSFPYEIDMALFSQKQNASKKKVFSSWKDWSPELCQQLDHICGPLMRELGYGAEPQWHEKLQK